MFNRLALLFLSAHTSAKLSTFLSAIAALMLLPAMVHAEETAAPAPSMEEGSKAEVIWEFDPYYTNVALYTPLTITPVPTITSDSETEIYSKLIEGSAIPRYMLLEASVYPMPVLGTYLKGHAPGFYSQGEIGHSGVNVFESATAGFQEPWAVSAFLGNIAKLVRPGETRSGSNMGYTGYLVSAGSKHIKDNVLIADNWYELEWKIKGKRDFPNDKLSWSFRVGGKFHDNPEVTDVVYASIHRSNLDANSPFLHWIKNTEFDLKLHFAQGDGQLVRGELIAGKKYPLAGKDYTPTLSVGVIWASPNEYSGALLNRDKNLITLVLRPSIEF